MTFKTHSYNLQLTWTGNTGTGTSSYTSYKRDHEVAAENKSVIKLSSDPAFNGDATKYNPEELLLASLSSCHMLWYLHLCSVNKIIVLDYVDSPTGIMIEDANGAGKFSEVILNPTITVKEKSMIGKANQLHEEANKMCFIAASVNFPVKHFSQCISAD